VLTVMSAEAKYPKGACMRFVGYIALVVSCALVSTGAAATQTVTLDFPSPDSTLTRSEPPGSQPLGAGGGGLAFVTGDQVSETFTGTGLSAATNAEFIFGMSNFTAAGVVNTFDVLINGVDVGDYEFTSTADNFGSRIDFDLTYSFAPIAGDTFALALVASSTVDSGLGSYNWFADGETTLSGPDAPSVPEPSTWALMLLGFGAAGVMLRQKRKVSLLKQNA
jgi:hypothetical protein